MATPDFLQFPRTCNVGPPLAALVLLESGSDHFTSRSTLSSPG